MTSTDFSENALVEQPAIELLQQLGWQAVNGFAEKVGAAGATLGRQTTADVILWPRLDAALRRLNPSLPDAALQQAVEILGKDRGALGLAHANREVYQLLKDGVRVSYTNDEGDEVDDVVRVIDWTNSNQNDFLVVSQLWVSGPIYKRRADLVGFVNGLPLLFIELKKAHGRLEHAYTANLRDYKQTVPQLFWYNALILLSNGSESKVGSVTSGWEHYGEWKRISSEGETGVISLETVLRGTCEPTRFLDDFAAMEQVVGRRYRKVAEDEGPWPDLVVIDGGKGQLNAAYAALEALGLEHLVAVGLAKQEELVFTRDRDEPIGFGAGTPALRLLQRIRDEAHRFAVTFHRTARTNRDLRSELDDVAGIGPRRRKQLLSTFGSVAGVRRASREDLTAAVGPKAADAVIKHFASGA